MPFPNRWDNPGYFRDSMRQDNTPATPVYLVQRDVFNMVAKRLGVAALTDLYKLREIFSEDDLRSISCFSKLTDYLPETHTATVRNILPSTERLFPWETSDYKSSEDAALFNRICEGNTKVALECLQYLQPVQQDDGELCCEAVDQFIKPVKPEKLYDVQAFQGRVFVILDRGFFKDLNRLQFLRDVLKVLYSQDRINNVNQGPWYGHYVAALKSEVSL